MVQLALTVTQLTKGPTTVSDKDSALRAMIYDALYGLYVAEEFGEHYVDGQEDVVEEILAAVKEHYDA